MKTIHKFHAQRGRLISGCLLLSVCLLALLRWQGTHARPSTNVAQGATAIEQLKKDGSYASLAAAMNAARYQIQPVAQRNWQALNPAQQFNATFSEEGLRIAERGGRPEKPSAPQWEFGLQLAGYGYGNDLASVSEGTVSVQGERIEMRKSVIHNQSGPPSTITEWYVNKPEGLEQGFTLQTPPQSAIRNLQSAMPLRLALRVTGALRAEAAATGRAVSLKDQQGRAVLSYDHLAAWDANHKTLPATMKTDGDTLTLEVDDTHAVYPVTIDPLIAQQAKLVAADGGANDTFGTAVALSGDTALIGAPGPFVTGKGAAYVFTRSGNSWTFQAKLNAADGVNGDNFGRAVALDGNTAAIGAQYADINGNDGQGAVYVFTRSGANWTQQQKLVTNDGATNDLFGASVALNGDTLLAGAVYADVNGNNGRGAAYVFVRSGGVWMPQQKLVAADGAANDSFGNAVVLSGDTALIGASQADFPGVSDQGAAYVFTRTGALWSQQAKLAANDGAANDYFGGVVALSGDTAVIGASGDDVNGNNNQGSAYVFTRNGTNWALQQKLLGADSGVADAFGKAAAISGDVIAIGAADYDLIGNQNQGAVYLFTRSGGAWSQETKFRATDGAAYDSLGNAIALSGNTLLVGSSNDDIGAQQNQGSVYVFTVANTLAQAQEFYRDPGQLNAEFGFSLALDGTTAVVGARNDTVGGLAMGAVYVYVYNGASWSYQQKLAAGDGVVGDQFGYAVAIHGDTLLAGAPVKPNGAAYVFTRTGGVWTQQQKLTPANPLPSNQFGCAVALKDDTALIGAFNDKVGVNNSQGAAYIFTRSGAVWSQQQKLAAADGAVGDHFGYAVAMTNYAAVIGAPDDAINGAASQGSAYVFAFNGATWSQQQKLTASAGGVNHYFGTTVALESSTLLVGAPGNGGGVAHVFVNNGATWMLQQELFANDGAVGHAFGSSVALSGELAVIGAPKLDTPQHQDEGAAYLFERQGATWSQRQKLTANDAQSDDQLGWAVAIAGPEILASAYRDDFVFDNSGSVYYFRYAACPSITFTNPAPPNGTIGASYNQQLAATGGSGPYAYSFAAGVLPPGLALSPSGLLAGTPSQPGTYTFTINALTPSLCSGSQSYTIIIAPICAPLTITPATLPNATVGTLYQQSFSALGGTAPYAFNLAQGALPPGLGIVNGALSGVPAQTGVFNFTIQTIDVNGCTGSQGYALIVTPACPAVTVLPVALQSGHLGAAYNQIFSGSGGQAPYTAGLTAGSLPPGLTLGFGNGLSGTPTQLGSFNFTITLNDANQCTGSRSYSLTISPACNTLTATPASLPAGTQGVAYNQTLIGQGGVAPYTFTIEQATLPVPGLTLSANGALTGTPTTTGTFPFEVQLTDVNGCVGTLQRSITINPACGVLTINPQSLPDGTTGSNYNVQLTTTGANGAVSYAVTAGALPNGLTLTPAGLLAGAPTAAGVTNCTVTATDANGCMRQQAYTLTINPSCPTITVTPATLPSAFLNVPFSQQLSASGGTGPYTFSPNGTLPGLTLSPGGLLSGTPSAGGQFGLTVNVTDANGCTGSRSYSVTITGCPTITLAPNGLPTGTVNAAYNQTITASGGLAPYSYSVLNGNLPAGLSLSSAGALTGTPTTSGQALFTLKATDAGGCTGTLQYALTINSNCPTLNIGPNPPSPAYVGVLYQHTFNATGGTAPYTYSLVAGSQLLDGLTLSTAGLLSGTPTGIGGFGSAFTVKATDANGCTGQTAFGLSLSTCPTITVNPASLPAGQMGAAYNQTITATGGVAPYSFSVSVGTLPNGLTLTTAGVLSGTPTVSGQFGFTIKATAANGCFGTRDYLLTTNGCPTITVNPASLPNGTLGAAYNQTLTASGGTGPYVFSLQSGAWPAGVSLSGAGVVSGTPTVNGSFNATVKATDANGCIGTRSYTLNVSATCPTITVNPATLPGGFAGAAYNQQLSASGGTGPYTFTVNAGVLPNGVTLSTAGVLSGTPVAAGSVNFTIKATDAQGCAGTRAYTVNFGGAGLMFYPLPFPLRLLDTRAGQQGCDTPGAPIAGGTARTQLARRTCNNVTIPANALAVTGNVTTVQSGGGYLTLYPSNAGQPLVANTNFAPNEILNNVFTVGLGNDGAFKIFATSNTDVAVDVTGYYAPPSAQGLYFHPLPQPLRLLDTRAGQQGCFTPGAPLAGGADTMQMGVTTCSGVTIPAAARALVGNATTVNPQSSGYLTLFPADAARPLAASSNFAAGQVMNAPFTVGLSAAGAFKIYTTATTNLVIDVAGYYSTEANDVNGQGLLFSPLPQPIRLLETRAGLTGCYTPNALLGAGSTRNQQARGTCSGVTVAQTARAIVGNATVVGPLAPGYLTFWPNGAVQPLVATSNYLAGQIFNRHFTVGLGVDGVFNIFTTAQTELVIDVSGFFAP